MIRKIRWLLFLIKYKLGLAKEGRDFVSSPYSCLDCVSFGECFKYLDTDLDAVQCICSAFEKI